MMYIVKSVVCDYGVFEKTDNEEKLIVICNSLSNAELIADILNTDLGNTKYKIIKPSKIDEAIAEIESKKYIIKIDRALEILKRNIGE